MDKKIEEKICGQRFLNWYNKQHRRNYILQRADTYFPDLKNKLNWDFIAYERNNPQEWIGIEVKELPHLKELSIRFKFWRDLCSELTKDLAGKGVQGEFGIFLPPVFNFKPGERPKFRKAFIEVLASKEAILKADFMDIGTDIASKFPNWPSEKSRNMEEYDKWGEYRPSKLEITKRADSGCKVISLTSPLIGDDVVEAHKEAFNEVFKLKNDAIRANEQLKLAKEKRGRETILLLACDSSVDEDLIKNQLRNLDRHLIPDIDCIYLVDIGTKDKVATIYPG